MRKDATFVATMEEQMLFELLQVSAGERSALSCSLGDREWETLWKLAIKHSIEGVVASSVMQLVEEQRPSKMMQMRMLGILSKVKTQAEQVARESAMITQRFGEIGLETCILKGPAVAEYYPDAGVRSVGDVDIWAWSKDDTQASSLSKSRKYVVDRLKKYTKVGEIVYHHADVYVKSNIPIEVHFTPTWRFSPCDNAKLQKWMWGRRENRMLSEQGYYKMDSEFDRVFLAEHICRHLFDEGVGLRQIVDYYWVMKQCPQDMRTTFRGFHTNKFVVALEYVVSYVMQGGKIPHSQGLAKWMLSEIMQSGNFGHEDVRNKRSVEDSRIKKAYYRLVHSCRMLRHFPKETLWELPWRTGHYLWRLQKGYL